MEELDDLIQWPAALTAVTAFALGLAIWWELPHYAALVVTPAFEGKRPIARHQMVYQCLGSLMGNEIHAMSIRAHTPAEWADVQASGGE